MAIEGVALTAAAEATLIDKQVRELQTFKRWNGSAWVDMLPFESYGLQIDKAFSLAELEVVYSGNAIVSALLPDDKVQFNLGIIDNVGVEWWNDPDAKLVGYVDSLVYDEVEKTTTVRCLDKLKLLVDGQDFEYFYGAEFAWTPGMIQLTNTGDNINFNINFIPSFDTIYDPTQVVVYGVKRTKSDNTKPQYVTLDIDFVKPDPTAYVRLQNAMIAWNGIDPEPDEYFGSLDGIHPLAWAMFPYITGVGTGLAKDIITDIAIKNGFDAGDINITGIDDQFVNKIEFTQKEYANAFECIEKVLELINIPNFVLRCHGERLIGRVVTQEPTLSPDYTLYLPTKQDKEYSLKDVYTQAVTYGRHFSTDLQYLNEYGHFPAICTVTTVFDPSLDPADVPTQFCYTQATGDIQVPGYFGLSQAVDAILPYKNKEQTAYGFSFPWHTSNETQLQKILSQNSYIEIDLLEPKDIGIIRMLTPSNIPHLRGMTAGFKSSIFYEYKTGEYRPLNFNTITINNIPGQWFIITEEEMAGLPKIQKFRIYFNELLWNNEHLFPPPIIITANWACWRFEIYAPSLIIGKATLVQNAVPPSGIGWVDHTTYWSRATTDPTNTEIAADRPYIPTRLLTVPKTFKTEEYENIISQDACNELAIKILVNEVSKKFHVFTVDVLYSPHFDLFQTIELTIATETMNAMIIGIAFGKRGLVPTVTLTLMNYGDNT